MHRIDTLDGKDQLLLAYLKRNARATSVELAEKLGLSRTSVQARITRLERSGIIRGYTVVLGEEGSDDGLRCWLLIHLDKGAASGDVLDRIRTVSGVNSAYLLTGDFDVLADVSAKNTSGIDRARVQILDLEGIADVRTHVVLRAAS